MNTQESTDKRDAALSFLKANDLGVLGTVSAAGAPRARAVYYSGNDDFSIQFLTYANTRKAQDLAANPIAAFVISDRDKPATLQMEGRVIDETETATLGSSMERLLDTLRAKGDRFAPITRLDPAVIRYYKLVPTWIRWGDFEIGEKTAEVMTDIEA
ncbi:MAG: pyridoxamine 5'-phosphate oxidase family protein [Candidatus Pacebacteria bacterium]|nr:pyridoxamine 5'-phosphate oxidase family protein [Candidatus Paceibacterota bacterium]MBP9840055.1 pyridoxamine 5'-phosphate oxidase family protein [Candidatus Paceibacterota bacterium]